MDIAAAIESLRTGEESVRRRVVDELGRSGRPEAIEALLLAVGDESWPVRQAAAAHLERVARGHAPARPGDGAARRRERGHSQRGHGDLRAAGRGRGARAHGLLEDADEEVRNFAAVMLGPLKDRRAVAPLIAGALRRRRERASRRRRVPGPDRRPRRGDAPGGGPAQPSPGSPIPRSTPWARSPTRAPPPPSWTSWTTSSSAGPPSRPWAALADRSVLPDLVPHLHDPEPALRNAAIRAVVAIEQSARPRPERAWTRRCRPPCGARTSWPTCSTCCPTTTTANQRTAIVTLGWLREPRSVGPLVALLGRAGLQEHASHALVSIGFAGPRRPSRRGSPIPTTRCARGRCAACPGSRPRGAIALVAPLIHDPSTEVRAETVAAIGRLGDEDAAMLLFELLADESELIQESAMSALSRLPARACAAPARAGACAARRPAVRVQGGRGPRTPARAARPPPTS